MYGYSDRISLNPIRGHKAEGPRGGRPRRLMRALLCIPGVLHCATAVGAGLEYPELAALRLDEIQYIGTHNSYHIEPDQSVDLVLLVNQYGQGSDWPAARLVRSLAYSHFPLEVQLRLGIRAFELDVYPDRSGGRYADPGVYRSIRESGLIVDVPYDPEGLMDEPGFKVLHMQDIDVRSNCKLLRQCLNAINAWSESIPDHVPIIILIEPKEDKRAAVDDNYEPVEVIAFTEEVFQELEAEILSVISRDKIVTPDEVRGEHASLKAAIGQRGWPLLSELAGKILFILIDSEEPTARYAGEGRTLENKLMFANLGMRAPGSSLVIYTRPTNENHRFRIGGALAEGLLTYTRADANTEEARLNDLARQRFAFRSGAQIISTDYPFPDYRLSGYKVQFEGGRFVRCNPVTARGKCDRP